MKYYGIVDKLKKEHKPGIYGRRKYNQAEIKEINDQGSKTSANENQNFLSSSLALLASFHPVGLLTSLFSQTSQELSLQHEDPNGKWIIFDNSLMENDYNISDHDDLFYGLFDNFKEKEKVLESLLKSKGGSMLIIIAREDLPSYMHYGGSAGKFSLGLYTTHPKYDDMLIPLEGSADLVKNMMLEETLRAYEALGAKRIIINDLTDIQAQLNSSGKGTDVNASFQSMNNALREKTYGKGIFDPARAMKDTLFIHDLPNVVTTIKGRIHGNQILEKFVENVNLSAGLDINVLGNISGGASINYQRKWSFEVEFYDKNELTINSSTDIIHSVDPEKSKILIEKIVNVFKGKTMSQIDFCMGSISESEFSVLSGLNDSDKNSIIKELVSRSNMDGSISYKELEYVLTIAEKLGFDINKLIEEIEANYFSVLYFLKNAGKEIDNIIVASFPEHKIKAQFYPNNRIFIFNNDNVLLSKGSYSLGGRKITLDNGKTIESANVHKNIVNCSI
jgi:hypothetical protein